MAEESKEISAGIDAGTECIKAVIVDREGVVYGSAIKPRTGYFQERIQEVFDAALDDAKVEAGALAGVCATGFGDSCATMATTTLGETACHAMGAFIQFPREMSLIDIGGKDPKVIQISGNGLPTEIHTLRRCAAGIGTFLNYAARHLDVHPTRLQELAAVAEKPAMIGSYCSIFSTTDLLTRLREGSTREEVALGCLDSIADRVVEIGGFHEPARVSGGIAEYFPGILTTLSKKARINVESLSQPILVGAVGAGLWVFREKEFRKGAKGDES